MTFPLEALSPAIEDRAHTWTSLGMQWQVQPVQPNYGKAIVNAQLKSAARIMEMAMWSSGEVELATIHLPDDRMVNRHYALIAAADLTTLLDELSALLLRGEVPATAVASYAVDGGAGWRASRYFTRHSRQMRTPVGSF